MVVVQNRQKLKLSSSRVRGATAHNTSKVSIGRLVYGGEGASRQCQCPSSCLQLLSKDWCLVEGFAIKTFTVTVGLWNINATLHTVAWCCSSPIAMILVVLIGYDIGLGKKLSTDCRMEEPTMTNIASPVPQVQKLHQVHALATQWMRYLDSSQWRLSLQLQQNQTVILSGCPWPNCSVAATILKE